MIELSVSAEKIAAFRAKGELALEGAREYFPNEYCTLIERNQSQAHRPGARGPERRQTAPHP